jgi:N-acetyl-anhydromuramyl-L-alanine amidase AmpD
VKEGQSEEEILPFLVHSDPGLIKFLQARRFSRASRAPSSIRLIVIHATDGSEGLLKAEDCAARFAGEDSPKASAHYAVDANSVVQCVLDTDVAWHAPGANHNGIGIELCGRAKQTRAEWLDEISHPTLCIGAGLTARLCKRFNLPVRFVPREGLINKMTGITTHFEVSRAFKKSTHTDPGPGFPMDWFLQQVQIAYDML